MADQTAKFIIFSRQVSLSIGLISCLKAYNDIHWIVDTLWRNKLSNVLDSTGQYMEFYTINQVILAFPLVLANDLLEATKLQSFSLRVLKWRKDLRI